MFLVNILRSFLYRFFPHAVGAASKQDMEDYFRQQAEEAICFYNDPNGYQRSCLESNYIEDEGLAWGMALKEDKEWEENKAWFEEEERTRGAAEDEMAALDAAWDRYYDELAADEADCIAFIEAADESCPCGHHLSDHGGYPGDFCHKCDCPLYSTPLEWWDPPHITNVGGDKGGFEICE